MKLFQIALPVYQWQPPNSILEAYNDKMIQTCVSSENGLRSPFVQVFLTQTLTHIYLTLDRAYLGTDLKALFLFCVLCQLSLAHESADIMRNLRVSFIATKVI